MEWISRWWRQPDHYSWLSDYLVARNLQTFTRYMMAVIVGVLGVVPILMMFTRAGPGSDLSRALSIFVAVNCAVLTLLWCLRWPTRRQSAVFIVLANVDIAISCLFGNWPGTGIQGCAVFAALAGYVAFFHTSRYLVFTLAMAIGTGLICTAQIVADGDAALAVSKLLILVISTLAVPFSIQVLVHTLGLDSLKSDIDSLTNLPNRRGFRRSANVLAAKSSRDEDTDFTIVMVDLDDFKRINDTAGHAEGDRTLIAVGGILRRFRRGDSVAGRVGGEEFVVAISGDRRDALESAERIRGYIEQVPSRVTASVGVASTTLRRVAVNDIPGHVDRLLDSADQAMYNAKRAGGNQVHVAGRPSDAYLEKSTPDISTVAKTTWTAGDHAPSGEETNGTTPVRSDPTGTGATPTRVPPEIVKPFPTVFTTAKKRL